MTQNYSTLLEAHENREAVKEYYANLLILQYHSKFKARETIKVSTDLYLADGLLFQLENLLDIDTAQGAQLDIIGKILDCPRTVQGVYNDTKYFQFHVDEESLGFSTIGNPSNGTFKTIQNYQQSEYSLPDEDYRFLLKFKSAVNIMRGSEAGIDEALYNAFGGDVILKNNQDLTITYIVSDRRTLAVLAAKSLGYYRAPEGVGADYILKVYNPSQIFGFNQKDIIKKTIVGFSTKNSPQTATWLTKNNLISLRTE